MNNPYLTKDKIEAPLPNLSDNGNKIRKKIHLLRFWLKQIDLAYEGYLRSHGYASTDIPEYFQNEGENQQKFYSNYFGQALDEIRVIWEQTCPQNRSNMEGK
jgi:hypothetical protein